MYLHLVLMNSSLTRKTQVLQSGIGPYKIHFTALGKLFERFNILERMKTDLKLRALVAMLVW